MLKRKTLTFVIDCGPFYSPLEKGPFDQENTYIDFNYLKDCSFLRPCDVEKFICIEIKSPKNHDGSKLFLTLFTTKNKTFSLNI